MLQPISVEGSVGIEVTLGKTLLYAYYGAIFVGKYRVYDTNPAKPVWVGYGYEGSANSQNRQIQEGTFGFNQTLIKDAKYGAVNLMGQWAYFTRSPWVIATGAAKDTHMNEVWLNLRYTFPGAPPSLK